MPLGMATGPDPLLVSLIGGGFVAAFLHTALPTHWLPFVLVGRGQGWSGRQTLAAAGAAALAHTVSTALAGSLLVIAGLALDHWLTGVLPFLSAASLFLMGGWYLWRFSRRPGRGLGAQAVATAAPRDRGDLAALLGLVAMLAASPGEVLLPMYLGAVAHGWAGLMGLTVAFWAGATLGMLLLTGLAWAGASRLRLERLVRYEGMVLGLALIGVGLVVVFHPH